jgi:hypothetical protein
MEANYWTRRRDAASHSFIRAAGRDENYWTRELHAAAPARAAAVRARRRRIRSA